MIAEVDTESFGPWFWIHAVYVGVWAVEFEGAVGVGAAVTSYDCDVAAVWE